MELTAHSYLDVFSFNYKALSFSLLIAILLTGTSAYYAFIHFLHSPLSTRQETTLFTLAPGVGVKVFVRQLENQGVVTHFQGQLLRWWIQLNGSQKSLQAGEYLIPANISPEILLEKFVKGEVVQYSITFSEGRTFEEILKQIMTHPAIKKTIENKSGQEIMGLLGEDFPPEGLFFPDTYYFTAKMTDMALLQRARNTMQERLKVAWEKRDPRIILKTPYEGLILASIIEKEAAIKEERFLVSRVFHSRLAKNMRLQADPTVSYGLKNPTATVLTRDDLKKDTPYNTYLHKGLPPTPIALPGWEAIDAAFHPAESDAIYFVAKGDGTHYFSSTLKDHNIAVLKYQRGIPQNE